ncbi:MAG: hypothetical protein ABFR95_08175, partial [Actinomycetota bacterium]
TAVSIFGAVQFEDPPSRDSFSATTIPDQEATATTALRALNEVIPGWQGSLTLATSSDGSLWSLHWEPTFSVPTAIKTPWESEPEHASFSASGFSVAALGTRPDSSAGFDVRVSPWPTFAILFDLLDVQSAVWHADWKDSIAWIANPADGSLPQLHVTDTAYEDGPSSTAIAAMPDGGDLVRWDNDGFVLNAPNELSPLDEIVVLDAEGVELWALRGTVHAVSPNTIVAILPTGQGPRWYFVDRATGEATSVVEHQLNPFPAQSTIVADPESEIFASLFYVDGGTTEINRTAITIISSELNAPRLIQIDRHVTPIGFARGTPFLVLDDARTNNIVFVDWLSGATHILDVPRDHEVLSVHLSPTSED